MAVGDLSAGDSAVVIGAREALVVPKHVTRKHETARRRSIGERFRTALKARVVTEREPTLEEVTDLMFAWKVVRHVKSNAIVLAHKLAVVGVGAGQMNRVASVQLALEKAENRARGSVLASDAFFPFADGVEATARAGITAIIQPGGSIRDEESIQMANHHAIAMIFTGQRHFRH